MSRHFRRSQRVLLSALSAVLAMHCAYVAVAASQNLLADPAQMLLSGERIDFAGANAFGVETGPTSRCLRSTPDRSASALYQRVHIAGHTLSNVFWTWRVDTLQRSADIRALVSEDVGATVMFIFGEPSFYNKDVPTLAYVWTATPVANGAVLPSRRYHSLAYIQLRGRADVGQWQREQRNVASDFRTIFGREPGPLSYIAVFNDNDQTNEATSALFGPIVGAD